MQTAKFMSAKFDLKKNSFKLYSVENLETRGQTV